MFNTTNNSSFTNQQRAKYIIELNHLPACPEWFVALPLPKVRNGRNLLEVTMLSLLYQGKHCLNNIKIYPFS